MSSNRPTEKVNKSAGRSRLPFRFVRDRRGSTAVEFALLALPFSLFLFAILESCISFAAQQVLSNATYDIARQVRTGELRAADLDETKLRDLICSRLEVIVTSGCPGLKLDLRPINSFEEAAQLGEQWDANNSEFVDNPTFAPGGTLSINVLRAFYRWPIITTILIDPMANLPNGKMLLFSMAAWQNEPF